MAQVSTITFGGTWEADDNVIVNLTAEDGTSTSVLTTVSGSTVIQTIINTVITAANNAATPTHSTFLGLFENLVFATPTSTTLSVTASEAGVPFSISVSSTETGGGAADAQTISVATTTTVRGPEDWANTRNWSDEIVPVNSDTVWMDGAAVNGILYGLNQSAVTVTNLTIFDSFVYPIGQWTKISGLAVNHFPLKLSATLANIHEPALDGTGRGGSQLIIINFGTAQATVNVKGGPASGMAPGMPPVMLVGTHASNRCSLTGSTPTVGWGVATVGAAYTLTHAENHSQAGTLTLGATGTITNVNQTGNGRTFLNAAVTGDGSSINYGTIVRAGTLIATGTGTITKLTSEIGSNIKLNNARGGTAVTTLVANGGSYDSSGDPRTFTIATVQTFNVGAGARFRAVPSQVTVTTGSIPFDYAGYAGGGGAGSPH